MADVSALLSGRDRGGDADRGQIILITGFALAFTLVAVVLLLNTTIFTENTASRGIDRSAGEALEFRGAAIEGVGDALEAANEGGFDLTPFEDSVRSLSELLRLQHLDRGSQALVEVGTLTVTADGYLFGQSTPGDFRDADDDPGNWTVVDQVERSRAVGFTVDRGSLATDRADAFRVHLDDGDDSWTVLFYEDGGEVAVEAAVDGGAPTRRCSVPDATVTVDLTAGTAAGDACGALTWGRGLDEDYLIRFQNPDAATGTYEFTIRPDPSLLGITDPFESDKPPERFDAAYSVAVRLHYETPTVEWRTWIRVAPGEPEDA